jgi:hypothetical protein
MGRGGRVIFDRHVHRPYHPSQYHSLLDPPEPPTQWIPTARYWNTHSSHTTFLAFQVAPKDEQYLNLQNKPSYNHAFDASKTLSETRFPRPSSPPQVVRLPLSSGPGQPKKKTPKQTTDSKQTPTPAAQSKKKDSADARTQAVKSMMKQAQKQAQQNQAQLQLQQQMQQQNQPTSSMKNLTRLPSQW